MQFKACLRAITPHRMLVVLAGASAAILGMALVSQYGFNLQPCTMCMWQRYPYMLVIALAGGVALFTRASQPVWLSHVIKACIAILLVGSAIAFYHVGVELDLVPGPTACSGAGIGTAKTLEELRAQIFSTPLISCSRPAFVFLGISMAGWNGIMSTLLALIVMLHCKLRKEQNVSNR